MRRRALGALIGTVQLARWIRWISTTMPSSSSNRRRRRNPTLARTRAEAAFSTRQRPISSLIPQRSNASSRVANRGLGRDALTPAGRLDEVAELDVVVARSLPRPDLRELDEAEPLVGLGLDHGALAESEELPLLERTLVLLERAVAVERLGADVADHGGIAHEVREALEMRVVPRLEAQARRSRSRCARRRRSGGWPLQAHRRFGAPSFTVFERSRSPPTARR